MDSIGRLRKYWPLIRVSLLFRLDWLFGRELRVSGEHIPRTNRKARRKPVQLLHRLAVIVTAVRPDTVEDRSGGIWTVYDRLSAERVLWDRADVFRH